MSSDGLAADLRRALMESGPIYSTERADALIDQVADRLARLEQLRDAAAPVWQKLIDGSYGRATTLTKTEIDALGAALAGCATTQENTQ